MSKNNLILLKWSVPESCPAICNDYNYSHWVDFVFKLILKTLSVYNSNPFHCEVYSIQHYVTKFVSNFLRVLQFPAPIKLK
jgi:hypothetical protein